MIDLIVVIIIVVEVELWVFCGFLVFSLFVILVLISNENKK